MKTGGVKTKKSVAQKPCSPPEMVRVQRMRTLCGEVGDDLTGYYHDILVKYHGREVLVESHVDGAPFVRVYDLDGNFLVKAGPSKSHLEFASWVRYAEELSQIHENPGRQFPPVPNEVLERRRFCRALDMFSARYGCIPDEYRVFYRGFQKNPE